MATPAAIHRHQGVAVEKVPDALAPPPGHPRFPLLDSLRGIAVLAAIVGHAAYLGGEVNASFRGNLFGNLSMAPTVFFVLSAFLLYRPFVAGRLLGARTPTVREYGRRRFLRIAPLYWILLTLMAIYPGIPGVFSGDWWKYYGFLQIYVPAPGGIASAWTVCVEVSFYLALPLYVAAVGRVTRRFSIRGAVCGELIALAILGLGSALLRALDLELLYTQLQQTIVEMLLWFSLGLAMAVVSVWLQTGARPPAPLRFLIERPSLSWAGAIVAYGVLAVLLETAGGVLLYSPGQWIAYHLISGLVALLLFIPGAFGDPARGVPRRLMSLRATAWVGKVSYSAYLLWGVVVEYLFNHGAGNWIPGHPAAAMVLASLVVTLILAAVSYHLLERPILRLKNSGHYLARPSAATTRATM